MICINEMAAEHIHRIAELEKICFSEPWSEKSIASELDNPLACWLVALDDSRVVGYIGSQTVMGESDMMNVAVDPDFRRQGVGRCLVESLMEKLRAHGSRCLSLEVRASNEPAKALYNSLGFVQVGRRPNYYYSPREDACILRKEWQS